MASLSDLDGSSSGGGGGAERCKSQSAQRVAEERASSLDATIVRIMKVQIVTALC